MKRLSRFLASGVAATLLNLLILWLLTAKLGMWYLAASILAFLVSLACNFTLQKSWAFSRPDKTHVRKEFLLFGIANALNLAINTAALYVLVERFGMQYLVAQLVIAAFIATLSFCEYRFIFSHRREPALAKGSSRL